METDQNTELLNSILQELQTLNANFSQFSIYVENHDKTNDETASADKEVLDSYMQKLETIDANVQALADREPVQGEVIDYTEYAENIEYNSTYLVILDAVVLGLLAIVAGMFLARTVFRKL